VILSKICGRKNLTVNLPFNVKLLQDLMHHIGLYMAKGRGAKIVDRVVVEP
jgi:hypothetical protein